MSALLQTSLVLIKFYPLQGKSEIKKNYWLIQFFHVSFYSALERIGNVYQKQNQLEKALDYFEKSVTEFRSETVLKKTNKVCSVKSVVNYVKYIYVIYHQFINFYIKTTNSLYYWAFIVEERLERSREAFIHES